VATNFKYTQVGGEGRAWKVGKRVYSDQDVLEFIYFAICLIEIGAAFD
jgi:hypothetical protein